MVLVPLLPDRTKEPRSWHRRGRSAGCTSPISTTVRRGRIISGPMSARRSSSASPGFTTRVDPGTWQNGEAGAAIESIRQAIAMARKSGATRWSDLGCLARALARQGYHDDARRTIEDALATAPAVAHDHPAIDAAEVYLELDEPALARDHALHAFELAWADGLPHSWWWPLQRSRRVLKRLGVADPRLPPFDPSRVEKIPTKTRPAALSKNYSRAPTETSKLC